MVEDKDLPAGQHEVSIINREQVTIKGVVNVESFDDEEVILGTEVGTLAIRGEDLHIRQLDLAQGSFAVEGLVTALQYSQAPRGRGPRGKGKGLLDRLLR
ncbi:MAG: sporulation protein YabP [Acetobacteraceae bacterium]|nr:sporulation protein YabP [Acetobacteraceae bacterium]